jgi:hypothetical protein
MTRKYKFIFSDKIKKYYYISQYAIIVKIFLIVNNPQVTKVLSILVGTSEHIRLLSKNFNFFLLSYGYWY